MNQVLVSTSFLESNGALSKEERLEVLDFIARFMADPTSPGFSLERIKRAKSDDVWSARITRNLRAVVFKDRGTWSLLHVGHHDEAYDWAARRDIGRHPVTGGLQVVEVVETIREVEKVVTVAVAPVEPPLFLAHGDAYLLSLGVPAPWLPALRALRDADQLLGVAGKLPPDVAERLINLATGEIVTPPLPLPAERPASEAAEPRQFLLVERIDEVRAALAAPFDRWIAFLHPSQRAIVEGQPKGPVKVTGAAGTGKTVVALHRARFLSRLGKRVLLSTFTRTLCDNLFQSLRKLCTDEELARIKVVSLRKQALEVVHAVDPSARVAADELVRDLIQRFAPVRAPAFAPDFVLAEWECVIQRQGLVSWEEYRSARRTGRGRALSAADRKSLWDVFAAVVGALQERHAQTWAGLCRRGETLLAEGKVCSPYDAVILDELQDASPADLRFLKALCAGQPGNLLLAGDAGQRIYPGSVSLGAIGIDVRGRSHVLRINYRTTEQIRRSADRLLPGAVDDFDGAADDRRGTRSLLRGPAPDLRPFEDAAGEMAGAVAWIRQRLEAGLRPSEIGCFARRNKRVDELAKAISAAGVPCSVLGDDTPREEAIRLATMHRAKGLEFRAVLVVDVSEGTLPDRTALWAAADPQDREMAEAAERQLLYVAMTRARDLLAVSWHGMPSRLLVDAGLWTEKR